MSKMMPGAAGDLSGKHPKIWSAFPVLGKATAAGRPLSGRERHLVELALAVGAGSEGAVHSHIRRARSEGVE